MGEEIVLQMLISGRSDLEWFESNLDSLKSRYNNKFIAFRNKEVIDTNADLDILMAKLRERGIDTSNIFVKFVSRVKAIL